MFFILPHQNADTGAERCSGRQKHCDDADIVAERPPSCRQRHSRQRQRQQFFAAAQHRCVCRKEHCRHCRSAAKRKFCRVHSLFRAMHRPPRRNRSAQRRVHSRQNQRCRNGAGQFRDGLKSSIKVDRTRVQRKSGMKCNADCCHHCSHPRKILHSPHIQQHRRHQRQQQTHPICAAHRQSQRSKAARPAEHEPSDRSSHKNMHRARESSDPDSQQPHTRTHQAFCPRFFRKRACSAAKKTKQDRRCRNSKPRRPARLCKEEGDCTSG